MTDNRAGRKDNRVTLTELRASLRNKSWNNAQLGISDRANFLIRPRNQRCTVRAQPSLMGVNCHSANYQRDMMIDRTADHPPFQDFRTWVQVGPHPQSTTPRSPDYLTPINLRKYNERMPIYTKLPGRDIPRHSPFSIILSTDIRRLQMKIFSFNRSEGRDASV